MGREKHKISRPSLKKMAAELTRKGMTVAVAESCTGGLLGAELTSLPGSSAFFAGGITAYEDRVKAELLGVGEKILREKGAVSIETAAAMADGIRRGMGVDLGLSITGVAGPGGGTPNKPVGRVYLGAAWSGGQGEVELNLAGNRAEIRRQAVEAALSLAGECLPEAVPRSLRTFLALPLPPEIGERIHRAGQGLRESDPRGRWIKAGGYHLTLKFLGETAPADLPELRRAADQAAAAAAAFSIELEGAGTFPGKGNPRVVWAGIGSGAEPTVELAEKLETRIARLGYPPDSRPFSPHITLGRPSARGKSPAFRSALREFSRKCSGSIPAEMIVFFRSTLTPSGPIHRELSRHRLGDQIETAQGE